MGGRDGQCPALLQLREAEGLPQYSEGGARHPPGSAVALSAYLRRRAVPARIDFSQMQPNEHLSSALPNMATGRQKRE